MDLADLEVFRTVAREGGVIRAAERLNRVQSAVTSRVKGLEADLGTELFLREARGMRLTPSGEVLLGYADRLIDLASAARSAVQSGVPTGEFRLGSIESTAVMRLARPLTLLTERYKTLELSLTVDHVRDVHDKLVDGQLEAAFIAGEYDDKRLEGEVVFTEAMALVMPATCKVTVPDTMLVFGHDCPNRARLQEWYAAERRRLTRTVAVGSYPAMLGSIAVGMGAAVMPEDMVRTFPDHHRLKTQPLPEPFRWLDTRLLWRKGTMSPRIKALLTILGELREAKDSA